MTIPYLPRCPGSKKLSATPALNSKDCRPAALQCLSGLRPLAERWLIPNYLRLAGRRDSAANHFGGVGQSIAGQMCIALRRAHQAMAEKPLHHIQRHSLVDEK